MQVAAMNLRKIVLFPWNHSKLVMHTCEVFCGLETCNLHSICVPSTPSHWLICSRRRSSFIRANHMTYARTSLSMVMVSNQNSVVLYYKTTLWSCLSGTTCSHDGGSPVIWKFRWVAVEPISSILSPPMNHVEHQPSVGNLCKHFFVFRSWSICLNESSDFP